MTLTTIFETWEWNKMCCAFMCGFLEVSYSFMRPKCRLRPSPPPMTIDYLILISTQRPVPRLITPNNRNTSQIFWWLILHYNFLIEWTHLCSLIDRFGPLLDLCWIKLILDMLRESTIFNSGSCQIMVG